MKSKTDRNTKYLAFVRKQFCCICGDDRNIHAHHTESGGVGLKGSDYSAVPLCPKCHVKIHNSGRKDSIPCLDKILSILKNRWEESHAAQRV